MMIKKLLSILALLCLTVSSAWADVVASGNCGRYEATDVTWTLTDDGVMTISGTGAMADYASEGAPWAGNRNDITSIVIEEGVTSIGNYAFYNCINLETVTIPNSVTSIGENAFHECTSLTTVTIPNSVTSIGYQAFFRTGLTSITIPNSVTSISNSAFRSCSKLTTVTVYAPSCTLGDDAFFSSGLTNIYVFSDKVTDYKGADNWSSYESKISAIPDVTVSGVTVNQDPVNTSNYWCTYYHPLANVKINTTGVQIFKASLSGDELTLTKVDGNVIMGGQPVVLKAAAGDALDMESFLPSGRRKRGPQYITSPDNASLPIEGEMEGVSRKESIS